MSVTAISGQVIGWRDREKEDPGLREFCTTLVKTDTLNYQIRATKIDTDIRRFDPFTANISGTTAGTPGANKLSDNAVNNFLTDPDPAIVSGQLVVNTTDSVSTEVDSPANVAANTVDIVSDIFDSAATSGEGYEVYPLEPASYTWDFSGGGITINNGGSISITDWFLEFDTRYVVEIDVEAFQSGSQIDVIFGFPLGNTIGQIKGNGTLSFYGETPNTSNKILRISDSNSDGQFKITDIRLYKASEAGAFILDDSDTLMQFDSAVTHIRDYAVFQQDLSALADACYEVCIIDEANLIENGAFGHDDEQGWTMVDAGAAGWVVTGNELVHNTEVGAGSDDARADLLTALVAECEYSLTWDQTGTGSMSVLSRIDGTGTEIGVGTGAYTSGSNSLHFVAAHAADQMVFSADNNEDVQCDNIILTARNDTSAKELPCCAARSYPVCLVTSTDLCKVIMRFNSSSYPANRVQLGRVMYYSGTTYEEYMWLDVNVRHARYRDDEFEQYRDSDGTSDVVFSDRLRVYELQVAPIPEYGHDWLSLALRAEEFEVNGDNYSPADGDYSPNWVRNSTKAPVTVDVVPQVQLKPRTH